MHGTSMVVHLWIGVHSGEFQLKRKNLAEFPVLGESMLCTVTMPTTNVRHFENRNAHSSGQLVLGCKCHNHFLCGMKRGHLNSDYKLVMLGNWQSLTSYVVHSEGVQSLAYVW